MIKFSWLSCPLTSLHPHLTMSMDVVFMTILVTFCQLVKRNKGNLRTHISRCQIYFYIIKRHIFYLLLHVKICNLCSIFHRYKIYSISTGITILRLMTNLKIFNHKNPRFVFLVFIYHMA